MKVDYKNENFLMNKSNTNQIQNQNMLYFPYQNQINSKYNLNPMNFPINQNQYYQKMKFNNFQNNYLRPKRFLYTQNVMDYPQLYPNCFSRNDTFIQNKYQYRKDKKYKNKNKKYVLTKNQNNEELSKINDEKIFYDKLKRKQKDSYINAPNETKINSYSENQLNENYNNFENNETLNKKNNKTEKSEKKEDEDFYKINEENIKTTRRFSQRSKRSSDSDNSNYSNSTALTKNDSEKDTIPKDVSFQENENLTKKEEKTEYKGNPAFENTEILNVHVKISENNTAIFKLKRYDDIFMTIQYFCEINNLKEEMIKPLIIKSLCAINTIYQVMNSKMDAKNLELLKEVQNKV